jgi:hypothetical protein
VESADGRIRTRGAGVAGAAHGLEVARELVARVHAARRAFRMWSEEHPIRAASLRELEAALARTRAAIVDGFELVLGVREHGFAWRGRAMTDSDASPEDRTVERWLAAQGVRAVRFAASATRGDLAAFIEWLAVDRAVLGDGTDVEDGPWHAEASVRLLPVDPGPFDEQAATDGGRPAGGPTPQQTGIAGRFLPLQSLPRPEPDLPPDLRAANERAVVESPRIQAALGILAVFEDAESHGHTPPGGLRAAMRELLGLELDRFDLAGVAWILDEVGRRAAQTDLVDELQRVVTGSASDPTWWEAHLRRPSEATLRALPPFLMRLGPSCLPALLSSPSALRDPRVLDALGTLAGFDPDPFLDQLGDPRPAVALASLEVLLRIGVRPPADRVAEVLEGPSEVLVHLRTRVRDPEFAFETDRLRQGLLRLLADSEVQDALQVLDDLLSIPPRVAANDSAQDDEAQRRLLLEAAGALAASPQPEAREILLRHASQGTPATRSACHVALRAVDTQRAR